MSQPYPARTLLGAFMQGAGAPVRRPRIFVSYQHDPDQPYYDLFSRTLHDSMDLVYDNSLEKEIDSDDNDYVRQAIRDRHISGTSCTIVLCGPTTYQRKFIDWEIKATLDKGHGLIGIGLPTVALNQQGQSIVPDRLASNYDSGYAIWKTWNDLATNPALMASWIQEAVSRETSKIINAKALKPQNR